MLNKWIKAKQQKLNCLWKRTLKHYQHITEYKSASLQQKCVMEAPFVKIQACCNHF